MGLVPCPECQHQVSDKAAACPQCGYPLHGAYPRGYGLQGYEYKSKRTLFGLPLVHIVYGPSWAVGLRPARGIIAMGNVAIGGHTITNDPEILQMIKSSFGL